MTASIGRCGDCNRNHPIILYTNQNRAKLQEITRIVIQDFMQELGRTGLLLGFLEPQQPGLGQGFDPELDCAGA